VNCKKCKKEIPPESIYCMWCGAPQKKDKRKHLYQRPDGLFEKTKTIDGKRVVFRGKTEDEVYRKIATYKPAVSDFKTIAEAWHEEHWKTISYNTTSGYEPAYARAVEHFGSSDISSVKPAKVKAFLFDFAAKGYAQKTVNTQLNVLRMIFNYALVNGYIESNPADHVSAPKNLPKTKRDLPDDTTLRKIEEVAAADPFGLFPAFLLYTGCRRGEALAIQFKDIDREKKTITISKSVYYVSNSPHIKTPKTEAGVRTVPLLPKLEAILPKGPAEHYLFSKDGASPLPNSLATHRLDYYKKRHGLSFTPHQLRHAYATILYDAGVDRLDAQHLLGHASPDITEQIYTHIRESRKEKVFKNIEKFSV